MWKYNRFTRVAIIGIISVFVLSSISPTFGVLDIALVGSITIHIRRIVSGSALLILVSSHLSEKSISVKLQQWKGCSIYSTLTLLNGLL